MGRRVRSRLCLRQTNFPTATTMSPAGSCCGSSWPVGGSAIPGWRIYQGSALRCPSRFEWHGIVCKWKFGFQTSDSLRQRFRLDISAGLYQSRTSAVSDADHTLCDSGADSEFVDGKRPHEADICEVSLLPSRDRHLNDDPCRRLLAENKGRRWGGAARSSGGAGESPGPEG